MTSPKVETMNSKVMPSEPTDQQCVNGSCVLGKYVDVENDLNVVADIYRAMYAAAAPSLPSGREVALRCADICREQGRIQDSDHGAANTGGAVQCENEILAYAATLPAPGKDAGAQEFKYSWPDISAVRSPLAKAMTHLDNALADPTDEHSPFYEGTPFDEACKAANLLAEAILACRAFNHPAPSASAQPEPNLPAEQNAREREQGTDVQALPSVSNSALAAETSAQERGEGGMVDPVAVEAAKRIVAEFSPGSLRQHALDGAFGNDVIRELRVAEEILRLAEFDRAAWIAALRTRQQAPQGGSGEANWLDGATILALVSRYGLLRQQRSIDEATDTYRRIEDALAAALLRRPAQEQGTVAVPRELLARVIADGRWVGGTCSIAELRALLAGKGGK